MSVHQGLKRALDDCITQGSPGDCNQHDLFRVLDLDP